jgi:hypothetical protein
MTDDEARWARFRDRVRLISPRFELQEIVAQLSSLVQRRAAKHAPDAPIPTLAYEPLGDAARQAINQIAKLLRQDGEIDFANELDALLGPKQGRGHPKFYNDDDNRRLLLDFCDVVEAQAKPNAFAAAKAVAEQEPWRSQGRSAAAIRTRLTDYLRQDDGGPADGLLRREKLELTLAEFAKRIWDAKRAEG